ncbi:hypothetical protein JGS6364_24981 [[Clostridium] sordellii]|uniref:Uncharacterized protein n=1 Tax=Paraclostridium sordellii TaxID=1505 RepID=A0ABM9RR63_PARSO|nr:hypothetical protein [Paeniclostridium sordellii]TAN67764.1 hypothetical protein WS9_007430 [Paeniclostridium sordellii 8483]CEJ74551.1 hypothetical protein ATCC9714_24391 [[Clostridium] sordellii] [Paeniclostridium sordellii]CEK31986.1 hypothetical protein JGS6364_24981 [[Clostridium] sordellii] [Paeniclostridium sordellii]CEN70091.1 Uncharacterised protein [[Clostridium] sordellii] [Paeniclostridium sordellii]CEN73414.1 Uncharacterised protein [[Clostridium] sordellii] [Paeniclostridium s
MKKESKVIVVSTILTTTLVTSFTLSQGPIVLADENYTKIASRENIKNYDMNDEKENKTELKEDIVLEKDIKNLKVKNGSYTNITNSQVKSNTQPSMFNNTSTIKPQVIHEESKEPIVSKPIDSPTEEELPTEELPTPEPPIVETPEEIPLDQDINSSEFTEETGL